MSARGEQYQLAIEMSIVDLQGSDIFDQLAAVHLAAATILSWSSGQLVGSPGTPSRPRRIPAAIEISASGSNGRYSYFLIRIDSKYSDFLIRIDLMTVLIPRTPGVSDGPAKPAIPERARPDFMGLL